MSDSLDWINNIRVRELYAANAGYAEALLAIGIESFDLLVDAAGTAAAKQETVDELKKHGVKHAHALALVNLVESRDAAPPPPPSAALQSSITPQQQPRTPLPETKAKTTPPKTPPMSGTLPFISSPPRLTSEPVLNVDLYNGSHTALQIANNLIDYVGVRLFSDTCFEHGLSQLIDTHAQNRTGLSMSGCFLLLAAEHGVSALFQPPSGRVGLRQALYGSVAMQVWLACSLVATGLTMLPLATLLPTAVASRGDIASCIKHRIAQTLSGVKTTMVTAIQSWLKAIITNDADDELRDLRLERCKHVLQHIDELKLFDTATLSLQSDWATRILEDKGTNAFEDVDWLVCVAKDILVSVAENHSLRNMRVPASCLQFVDVTVGDMVKDAFEYNNTNIGVPKLTNRGLLSLVYRELKFLTGGGEKPDLTQIPEPATHDAFWFWPNVPSALMEPEQPLRKRSQMFATLPVRASLEVQNLQKTLSQSRKQTSSNEPAAQGPASSKRRKVLAKSFAASPPAPKQSSPRASPQSAQDNSRKKKKKKQTEAAEEDDEE